MNYCELLFFVECVFEPIDQKILRSNLSFELIYINRLSGSCTLYFEGGQHHLEPNDVIIIPADVNFRVESDCRCEYVCVGYSGSDYGFKNIPTIVKDSDDLSVAAMLGMMKEEFVGRGYKRKNMLNLLLNTTLIATSRLFKATDTKKETEVENFNYILHLMESQSHNGIDIETFAKMSGLSYHRFRHKFKELTGISPQQYIISQRLNFAKRLLKKTNYSTSSIAAACGFHSVPQFITCFNKQEGFTPVKYRKKVQAGK